MGLTECIRFKASQKLPKDGLTRLKRPPSRKGYGSSRCCYSTVFSQGKACLVKGTHGAPGVMRSGGLTAPSYMSHSCGVLILLKCVHVTLYLWLGSVRTAFARRNLWPSTPVPATVRIARSGWADLRWLRRRVSLTPQGSTTPNCGLRRPSVNCLRLPHDWKVAHCAAYSRAT